MKKPITIAIIAARFPPHGEIGGIEIATQHIVTGLARRGNRVFVVASGPEKSLETLHSGATIYRLPIRKIKWLGGLIFWLDIFWTLGKIKPDIVHVQTIQMALPAFFYKKICHRPYVVWCHGFDVYFPWKGKAIIAPVTLTASGAVVVLTNHMAEAVKAYYLKKSIVLPNGIDTNTFKGFSKQAIRDTLNVPVGGKIVIFTGRFYPVKGLGYLVEAFRTVSQKIPEAELWLVGNGADRESLTQAVAKNGLTGRVRFTGEVLHQKIPEYLAMADVFALPSLSEGFPLVILEAMALGLPIVASRVRGLPEIITDGENGFLVEPKNSAQLAQKIIQLLENPALRQNISDANKKKSQQYDWERVIDAMETIYSQVLTAVT